MTFRSSTLFASAQSAALEGRGPTTSEVVTSSALALAFAPPIGRLRVQAMAAGPRVRFMGIGDDTRFTLAHDSGFGMPIEALGDSACARGEEATLRVTLPAQLRAQVKVKDTGHGRHRDLGRMPVRGAAGRINVASGAPARSAR